MSNNDEKPSPEDGDENERFHKVVREGLRPGRPVPGFNPDSKWDAFKQATSELAAEARDQAVDRYNPKWPPTWLKVAVIGGGLIFVWLVLEHLVLPFIAWLLGLAGDGIGAAAGAGWSWASAWDLTDLVTHPVRAYLEAHAPALGLTPGFALWIWAAFAIGAWAFAFFGTVAGRIGWVLVGVATAAMVWMETDPAGRGLAVGIMVAFWTVLSLLALHHRLIYLPVRRKDLDKKDALEWIELAGQFFGAHGGRFGLFATTHQVKDAADALDAIADAVAEPDFEDGTDQRRRNLVRDLRDTRNDLIGYRTYPIVPITHARYSGRWREKVAPYITSDIDDRTPVPDTVLEALTGGFVAGQAAQIVENLERTSAPAGDRRVLHDEELGRVLVWLWPTGPETVGNLCHDIYEQARNRLGRSGATVTEFLHDLDTVLPKDFDDRRALLAKVGDSLSVFPH